VFGAHLYYFLENYMEDVWGSPRGLRGGFQTSGSRRTLRIVLRRAQDCKPPRARFGGTFKRTPP
jgi:hypothetical protein